MTSLNASAAAARSAAAPAPPLDVRYAAYVVGLEVMARLGRTLGPTDYAAGWHPTGTAGAVAGAAAGAHLLRLEAGQTATALSIAASRSGGVRAGGAGHGRVRGRPARGGGSRARERRVRTRGRANVVVRIPGEDRERGGLVIHGHLDVVPANAEDWSVDPFAAEVVDGELYGRGAVDMKDMDGMILAVVRHLARTGQNPPRDLVIIMFADEEAGGTYGSRWMIEHRPDVFEGFTEAISEVGGYSITLPRKEGGDVRAYLLQTAEALIDELFGDHVELIIDKIGISLCAPDDTPFVEAMHRSILAEDPGAGLVPYCLSAGTDNKQLAQIGIDGYGFAPLQLPADLDFAPLFHGIGERVPVDAIRFGARVPLRLVGDC